MKSAVQSNQATAIAPVMEVCASPTGEGPFLPWFTQRRALGESLVKLVTAGTVPKEKQEFLFERDGLAAPTSVMWLAISAA